MNELIGGLGPHYFDQLENPENKENRIIRIAKQLGQFIEHFIGLEKKD